MSLDSRVAIVTGAGSGIGKAIAHELAERGAHVVVADLDGEAAELVAQDLVANGAQASPWAVNVAEREAVTQMAQAVASRHQRIDILVNNAGTLRDRQIKNLERADWQRVLAVNLGGALNCALAVLPYMERQRYGKIVSISSRAALGNFGQTNYASSKAGIIGMTRSLALEKGEYNININAVAPGYVETPMTAGASPELHDRALKATPLKRLGEPADIAKPVAFLCSDEASYVTGQCLFVCGGRSLKAARENWGTD